MKTLLAEGQAVQVTIRKAIELWQGSGRVRYAEGDVFMSTVMAVGDDGLLDLHILGEQPMRVHARDMAFSIEPCEG
jgi:hypothetical protein